MSFPHLSKFSKISRDVLKYIERLPEDVHEMQENRINSSHKVQMYSPLCLPHRPRSISSELPASYTLSEETL